MSPSIRNAPRALAETLERRRILPEAGADEEAVVGYGALGVPFESGHVLAFRRLVATSFGPPTVSLWHRAPDGRWTFYVDVEPGRSCARYFGAAVDEVVVADIRLAWTGPHTLSLAVPRHRIHWGMRVWRSPLTRTLNGLLGLLPGPVWEGGAALRAVGPVAGRILGVGGLRLAGRLPNGQGYRMRPSSIWRVEGSAGVVGGRELGRTAAHGEQPELGSFPLPNGGLFAFGNSVQHR